MSPVQGIHAWVVELLEAPCQPVHTVDTIGCEQGVDPLPGEPVAGGGLGHGEVLLAHGSDDD